MTYKWKPTAAQRHDFRIRMEDPAEQAAYNARKQEKAEKRRATSQFDYKSAGGEYVPTREQYNAAFKFLSTNITKEQENACNMVIYGYTCQEKVHHDYIHIVNELKRNSNQHI